MCEDHRFLEEFPSISAWLGFSPEANPFFIPPESLNSDITMVENSFVVFGIRPKPAPKPPRAKPVMPKFMKSP